MKTSDQTTDQITCPKCGSTQCHAGARGWTPQKGLLGMGKVMITCLKCGYAYPAGGVKQNPNALTGSAKRIALAVLAIVITIAVWGIYSIN